MPTAPDWNFGDILDALEGVFPANAPALIHGDRTTSWGEFSRRSNNLAARCARVVLNRTTRSGSTCATGPSTARRSRPASRRGSCT